MARSADIIRLVKVVVCCKETDIGSVINRSEDKPSEKQNVHLKTDIGTV